LRASPAAPGPTEQGADQDDAHEDREHEQHEQHAVSGQERAPEQHELSRRNVDLQGIYGVFYYRSGNARTLDALSRFMPVPIEGLTAEFAAGATAVDICARSVRALLDLGVRHLYISNLPLHDAATTLTAIMSRVQEVQ